MYALDALLVLAQVRSSAILGLFLVFFQADERSFTRHRECSRDRRQGLAYMNFSARMLPKLDRVQ